jgi:hypothetical protein
VGDGGVTPLGRLPDRGAGSCRYLGLVGINGLTDWADACDPTTGVGEHGDCIFVLGEVGP